MGDNKKQIRLAIFVTTLFVSVVAMSAAPIRSSIERLASPLEALLTLDSDSSSSPNPELTAENAQLKQRIKNLTVAGIESDSNQLTAEVISFGADPYRKEVIISRGSKDGLVKGMPVLAKQSLIGTISQLESNRATVQLINDPQSRLIVETEKGIEGLATGEFGTIIMSRIPRDADVSVGDDVVSTGGDGVLPAGIFVGKIRQIEDRQSLLKTAFIEPVIQPQDVRVVTIEVGQ